MEIETCWPKIRQIEKELEQQNPEKFISFVQHLAKKSMLSRNMLRGFIEGTMDSTKIWTEAHAFFPFFHET